MKNGVVIFGILLLVIGIILAAYTYNPVNECKTLGAKIVKFFSAEARTNCSTVEFLLGLGYGVVGFGVLLLIIGLVIPGKK